MKGRDQFERGKALARSVMGDNRAESAAMGAVNVIVGLMVGGLVAAFLLPIAITEITSTNTTEWSSGADSLWSLLDVIIVLAVFLFFIGLALKQA